MKVILLVRHHKLVPFPPFSLFVPVSRYFVTVLTCISVFQWKWRISSFQKKLNYYITFHEKKSEHSKSMEKKVSNVLKKNDILRIFF